MVQNPLRAGADRDSAWRYCRPVLPASRQGAEAARRRLHRPDQDDDRAGDLLHGRARHFVDGRSEARRPCRAQGLDLFRSRLDDRAGRRPHRRQGPSTRPWLQHRPGHNRSEFRRDLRHQGQGRGHCFASARDYSRQLFRRAGPRRPVAGPAGFHPVGVCRRISGQGRRADLPRRRSKCSLALSA